MKMLALRCLVALTLLAAAAVAFANPFKSKIITGTETLLITVPDDHFLKITNFSQVGGGTEHGVVTVTLGGENSGRTDVLTATRIDLGTGANSQNFPVIVAGPAEVRVQPVTNAKLFISYKKERDEGSGGGETPRPTVAPPMP